MKETKWHPGRLIELSGGYWQTCALHASVRLDLFTLLDKGPATARDLAGKINANQRALEMLLNALSAMALLEKNQDTYTNTQAASRFLSKNSNRYLGYIISHQHFLMPSWAQLDQSVLTGEPFRKRYAEESGDKQESFLMGMFDIANLLAPRVVEKIDLSSKTHFLDLGGGPGTYAIHFCKKYPQLKATVFDLASTRQFAEKTIRRFGLEDRICFQTGDFINDAIQRDFDVVLLSQILHGEGPSTCYKIVQNAASSLKPGGLMLIHEFILNNTMDGPVHPALFSLNMLVGTPEGQAYSEYMLRDMMSRADIQDIHRLESHNADKSGVLAGTLKPAS